MKKIVMLVGALVLCVMGFAKDGNSDSKNVGVYATVTKDLQLETSPVDFGLVTRKNGQEINEKGGGHPGEIVIKGEKNSLVKLEYQEKTWLKQGESSTLVYNPSITSDFAPGATVQNKGVINLGDDGEAKYGVAGTLDVPVNALPGKHYGTMWVKVTYVD